MFKTSQLNNGKKTEKSPCHHWRGLFSANYLILFSGKNGKALKKLTGDHFINAFVMISSIIYK